MNGRQLYRVDPNFLLAELQRFRAERKRAAVRRLKAETHLQVGLRYQAEVPIMVLAFRDNHDAAVTIPPGAVFDVLGTANDDRFVVVRVKGQEFLVFESDLKDRGRLVKTDEDQPKKSNKTVQINKVSFATA